MKKSMPKKNEDFMKIRIGDYNGMTILQFAEHGAYLKLTDCENEDQKILLPNRYVTEDMRVGDKLNVFIYNDSEDRLVATTETPFAKVNEFAFLQVAQINRTGAFLDWGLPKNLLVPFKEQKIKMFPGGIYLVYIYLDKTTNRVVASAKIEKFLGNVLPDYKKNDSVDALIVSRNEIGYIAIVDNRHRGMIYLNEIYEPLEIGTHTTAYIKQVRENDGKIDLTLTSPGTLTRIERIESVIMDALKSKEKTLSEKMTPEEIAEIFKCSKKDFKKAVGKLYREKKIIIDENGFIARNE